MKVDNHYTRQLQEQIAQGHQPAFENLYRLFFGRLMNFAMMYVHQKETAEEIVNDVMMKIWTKRDTLAGIQHLETYLFVAVRNHSLNHLNHYSPYHITFIPESGETEVVNFNDPERLLEWKEINLRLVRAIDELPDQCRTVFKLIKEEGFRYRQVAEILAISPRTVETQLVRAIKKLDKVVAAYLDAPRNNRKNSLPLILLLATACCCI